MSEHKYKVAYNIVPLGEGKTKAELQADPDLHEFGGTDEFIMFSTLKPEGGGRSVKWSSSDGSGKSLPPAELFHAMVIIARDLALKGELDKGREEVCWAIWNTQLSAMGLPEQELARMRKMFLGH
jgi:hypothetical protein